MTKLVINSDDFGYSKAVNLGIIESYEEGLLTSTTMMANMFGFDHGVKLAKEHPGLGIGVHLSLTCGYPVTEKVSSLVDEHGIFHSRAYVKEYYDETDLDQLYEEWQAQIQKVRDAKIPITHLDTHHYVHALGDYYQVMELLAKKFDVPIRNCFGVKEKLTLQAIAPTDDSWLMFNYPVMKDMSMPLVEIEEDVFEILEKDAQKYSAYNKIEGICHPGYLDVNIWEGSSFNLARMREIELLCSNRLKNLLQTYGYDLCRYDDL